ncbi:MAG: AAA family ATPase [Xanthomonadales bacterium]|nr:AAA family ATPase [Xanthomonadales bacterium]
MHCNGAGYCIGEPPAPAGKPLYRLPKLAAADPSLPVIVVEGEWAADALARIGVLVTTSSSADSAEAADWSPLAGRNVILWPDHDAPGKRYATAVAERLRALGCVVEQIDVDTLALPDKGDVVDWLALHPEADEEAIFALPRAAGANRASLERAPGRELHGPIDHPRVDLIEADRLSPEPIRWLWPGWLARGKLHVLAGAAGTGKTTIATAIAACVTAGHALPSGWRPERGNVIVWSGEDDPADTLVPRLLAAGADLSRVRFVGEVREDGERHPFDPARDVHLLASAVAEMDGVALMIVDPLVSAVGGDSHKNAEVRRGLAPLVDLAGRLDAALIGITHFSKGTGGREPLERVGFDTSAKNFDKAAALEAYKRMVRDDNLIAADLPLFKKAQGGASTTAPAKAKPAPGTSPDNPAPANAFAAEPPPGTWVRLPDGRVIQTR